jgi:DNA-binding response OmpR family regulator
VRVLVVESDPVMARSLTNCLDRHGYEAERVETGTAALNRHHDADLVVLDLGLPDMDGLALCRTIRAGGDVPIITLTDRGSEPDLVLSLQAGSDDCLAKPYGLVELMARIEAVLRRARPRYPTRLISHGPLEVDPAAREVRVHGRLVSLTRKEFDLLCLLASRPENVLSRKEIMTKVWDYQWVKSSRTVDTHVNTLRKKLGANDWIVTVRGVGFRLDRDAVVAH